MQMQHDSASAKSAKVAGYATGDAPSGSVMQAATPVKQAGALAQQEKAAAAAAAAARAHRLTPPAVAAPDLPDYLSVVQQIGKGAYGAVFLCNDARTNSQVAVKAIRGYARDPLFGKRILREIKILAALEHPSLLKLTDLLPGSGPDVDDVYIVMPYMKLDLHKVIYCKMKLTDSHFQAFASQILHGLGYLHKAGIIHRDLKPSNILVNQDCTLRIADLGLARGRSSFDEELTDYVVTRWYRAPELLLMAQGYLGYCEAVDLWSVGCMHVEMVSRKPLFQGDNHIDMLRRIANVLGFCRERDLAWLPSGPVREQVLSFIDSLGLPEWPLSSPTDSLERRLPGASEACLDFVRELLLLDPTRRMTAPQAVEHRYVANLRESFEDLPGPKPFSWDFDDFQPTKDALKQRIYGECVKRHPELLPKEMKEELEKLASRRPSSVLPEDVKEEPEKLGLPIGPPPNRAPRRITHNI
eukprot:TRINITY_DN82052_c0_g1_i1.p1 TRINITY_DN82052_c0_g1~~TRINITY_DN82052_c0_g1_i1.p1  ORF type:complete len:470 (+),score=120.42 TRINITY_DN82052_c0_g1_i1:76-1485(+)